MSHNIIHTNREGGGTIIRVIVVTLAIIIIFGYFGLDARAIVASPWFESTLQGIRGFFKGLL